MKALFASAALALVATTANAELDAPGRFIAAGLYNVELGVVDVIRAPLDVVRAACLGAGAAALIPAQYLDVAIFNGCTWHADGRWTVYVRSDLDPYFAMRVYLHELAHTAGWDHGEE